MHNGSRNKSTGARGNSIFTIDLVAVAGIAAGGLLASLIWTTPQAPEGPNQSADALEMAAATPSDSPQAPGKGVNPADLREARNSWVYSP